MCVQTIKLGFFFPFSFAFLLRVTLRVRTRLCETKLAANFTTVRRKAQRERYGQMF